MYVIFSLQYTFARLLHFISKVYDVKVNDNFFLSLTMALKKNII